MTEPKKEAVESPSASAGGSSGVRGMTHEEWWTDRKARPFVIHGGDSTAKYISRLTWRAALEHSPELQKLREENKELRGRANLIKFMSAPPTSDELQYWHDKCDRLEDALRLILPLAKGYACAHQVGSNAAYVEQAEKLLGDSQPPNPSPPLSSQWISVKERLPEGRHVSTPMKVVRILIMISQYDEAQIGWYFADSLNEFRLQGSPSPIRPTHWMPLPEPPKIVV